MKLFFTLILFLYFVFGMAARIKVDAIFYNGIVVTVDSLFHKAEAFAVTNGKFVAVGSTKEILEKYESQNQIDLQKKLVYPGFNDAHCHFMGYANDLFKCQLVGTKSFADVLSKVEKYAFEVHPTFIYGRGWDQNDWEIKEFPSNSELNTLYPDIPVLLERIDGHAALINNKLLRMADSILKPYYNSNYIEMKDGKPTGILFDNAMDAVQKLVPAMPADIMKQGILKAQEDCFALGITSLTDAGLSPYQINFIDSLQKANTLKMRINAMVSATPENLKYFEARGKIKTDNLNVRSLKVYADGALGSRGAKLKKEYSDKPGSSGELNIAEKEFDNYATWAFEHGFQLNTHAIGDSANKFVLEVYKSHLEMKNDLRWRIEHAQIVDVHDIHLFGDNKIIPSVQPTHATSDMYWAETRLGKTRMPGAYAYKSLLNQNRWIPLGTDFPVEYLNPQYTFYAAVSRKDAERNPKEGFTMTEALTREEALRGMTIWAAKAAFEENEKGSIEPGKYADFIIYDEDFMTEDLLKIRNSTPLQTYVNGIAVFSKK